MVHLVIVSGERVAVVEEDVPPDDGNLLSDLEVGLAEVRVRLQQVADGGVDLGLEVVDQDGVPLAT